MTANEELKRAVTELAKTYEKTLSGVEQALEVALKGKTPRAWGVAGLSESALVFLLAEAARSLGWTVEYEPSYANRKLTVKGPVGKTRADLLLTKDSCLPILIEAKWWWWDVTLPDILALDVGKLLTVEEPAQRVEVVFTVDEYSAQGQGEDAGQVWDKSGSRAWMKHVLERSTAARRWQLLGCAAVPSQYLGSSYGDPKAAIREGFFQAAFFCLRANAGAGPWR